MNKYYKAFKEIRGNRDIVFETILDYFNSRPIDILEIGCARNLDIGSRQSDGWSTCFWADYIFKNNGSLNSYDISKESVKNCLQIIDYWYNNELHGSNYNISICDKTFVFDESKFDLAFLDGGDDPNETLEQLKKCKEAGIEIILIDDFHTKGKLIQQPDTLWYWGNGHQLAAFGLKLGKIEMDNIE